MHAGKTRRLQSQREAGRRSELCRLGTVATGGASVLDCTKFDLVLPGEKVNQGKGMCKYTVNMTQPETANYKLHALCYSRFYFYCIHHINIVAFYF